MKGFEGIEEHLEAMRSSGSGISTVGRDTLRTDDHLGNAAHTVASLAALAQILSNQQALIEELEAQLTERPIP